MGEEWVREAEILALFPKECVKIEKSNSCPLVLTAQCNASRWGVFIYESVSALNVIIVQLKNINFILYASKTFSLIS